MPLVEHVDLRQTNISAATGIHRFQNLITLNIVSFVQKQVLQRTKTETVKAERENTKRLKKISQLNSSLSTSFSDFHPESWQSTQTISTVLVGLLSFMTEECPNAIGGMQMTKLERKKMAKESGAFNKRNAKFCKLFPYLLERM
jgi:two-component sensor histidine kinase